jgi:hypothetical protein
MDKIDYVDITDRVTGMGWTLPDGWTVTAHTLDDDCVTDPRNEGDCYATDVDEADYNNPTRAFCRHCEAWIRRLDADSLAGVGPDADGREAEPGDWADLATGIDCPGSDNRAHEPDEPLAVRAWRRGEWAFVTVVVQVWDGDEREWGRDSLGGTEAGRFPYMIDPETGAVEYKQIDPLRDPDHPLPDMIGEAMGQAREAIAKLQGAAIGEPSPSFVVSAEVLAAVRAVVAYNWADEQRDYEDQDETGRAGHIFAQLRTLDKWLKSGAGARDERRLSELRDLLHTCEHNDFSTGDQDEALRWAIEQLGGA